jgi:hypothetical protein
LLAIDLTHFVDGAFTSNPQIFKLHVALASGDARDSDRIVARSGCGGGFGNGGYSFLTLQNTIPTKKVK